MLGAKETRPVLALLAVFAIALGAVAYRTGVTIDEPAHLLSAHLYWIGADNLRPGDMPPAIKIVGGWVSHLFALPVPYDRKELWERRSEWDIAQVMMERLDGPVKRRVFFYSRVPVMIFAVLVGGILWLWARQLYSPRTAFCVTLLFCLSPTVLAHGSLFKNDLAASFGYLLFWYRAWRYWQSPSRANAAWLGLSLLIAVLTKMSLLILVPAAPLILLARCLTAPNRSWSAAAAHLIIVAGMTYAGTATAWQFRVNTVSADEIRALRSDPRLHPLVPAAAQLLRAIPTPQQLREGAVSLVQSNRDGAGVYLLGEVYPEGHPLYFLIAIATKVPVPLQFLLGTSLALLAVDLVRRRLTPSDAFWLVPPAVYLALASFSSLQLGVRLILPALVGLLLWSGRSIEFLWTHRASTAVLGLLLAWTATRTGLQYPDYLAYFNSIAGGSDEGIRYLSDSNLDWGQDLPSLAGYLERNPIPKIHLAYFGTDNPYAYIEPSRLIPIAPPWNERLVSGLRIAPEPGYYAISATLLTGQLFEARFRDYYRTFRESKPIAKAGYSIFIYKVP